MTSSERVLKRVKQYEKTLGGDGLEILIGKRWAYGWLKDV